MNTYLIVKTLHIISATLMVGTGFGTAFYLFWANRSGSVAAQSVVSHWVIKADWWFTTPAVIFQPLVRFMDAVRTRLYCFHHAGTKLGMDDARFIHPCRHLLAARCLAASPYGKDCRKSA